MVVPTSTLYWCRLLCVNVMLSGPIFHCERPNLITQVDMRVSVHYFGQRSNFVIALSGPSF
jgi:hypothetical protein